MAFFIFNRRLDVLHILEADMAGFNIQNRPIEIFFEKKSKNSYTPTGIDNMTWQEYGKELEERLPELHDRIQGERYQAKPSKRIWIPKSDGQQRPIGIAALEDKIVQQALTTVLSQIYEVDFLGFSCGSRLGRSQHNALDALYVAITQKRVSWVLDADISKFYDSLDHEWLLKFVGSRVTDPRMLRLLRIFRHPDLPRCF